MKRILFMIAPVTVLMLAFQPVTSVVVKGNRNGTVSNADGIYNITVADPASTKLIFSAAGFKSKEVKVKSKQVINVKLLVTENDLDEVVMTGKYW